MLHALPSMTILHYFSLFGIPLSVAMVLAFDIVRRLLVYLLAWLLYLLSCC